MINNDEKWIGPEIATSGSYFETKCSELHKRNSSSHDKLYYFQMRFDGPRYYISSPPVIEHLEELLKNYEEESFVFYNFIYGLIVDNFGVMEIVLQAGHHASAERDKGFRSGVSHARKEIRKALGLESF